MKIAERRNGNRNTVLVPVGGLEKLIDALNDAMDVVVADETDRKPSVGSKKKPIPGVPVPAPTVVAIPANEKCVFVSGFPKDTAEPDVVDFMRTAGVIFKVEMKGKGQFISAIVEVLDPLLFYSLCLLSCITHGFPVVFIFAQYTTVQAAQKAVDQFNDTTYLGQVIKCRADRGSKIAAPRSAAVADDVPVVSKSERKAAAVAAKTAEPKELDELKVFCTNLTFDTTEQVPHEIFMPC